jgi:hypothetical protein
MNANYTTSVKSRVTAFVFALATSALVLGSTVAGMQPHDDGASAKLIAADRVTATAPRSN